MLTVCAYAAFHAVLLRLVGSVSSWFLGALGLSADEFCKRAHQQEIDSSAVVVNRRKAWSALHVIDKMNQHWPATVFTSDGFLLGDKDTWLIGSMLAKTEVVVTPHGPGVLAIASADGQSVRICSGHAQSDASGRPLYYNGQQLDTVLQRVADSPASFDALRWVQASEIQRLGGYEAALRKLSMGVALSAGAIEAPPSPVAHALEGVATAFGILDRAGLTVSSIEASTAANIDPTSLRSFITRASRFSYLGQHGEAVAVLDNALTLPAASGAPERAPLQKLRCESLLLIGRHADALSACAQAVQLLRSVGETDDPKRGTDTAKAWSTYGVLFERLGRAAEALASHDSAVSADPSYAAAWHNRGVALEQLRRPAEAAESYRSAMQRGAVGSPDSWINLGNALRELPGQKAQEEALHSYSSAIALKPSFLGARFNKASLLASMRRTQEAVADYTAVLEQDPSYRQALVARGNAYLGSEELDRAEADYRASLRSDPQSVSELNNLCLVLHRLDRLDEALSTCRGALALDGTHGWARYNLGTTQHKLGLVSSDVAAQSQLYEASISSYRRVVSDHPGWVVVWESLEKVLSSASRMAESRAISAHARGLRQTLSTEGAAAAAAAAASLPAKPSPSPPLVTTPPSATSLPAVSATEVAEHLAKQQAQELTQEQQGQTQKEAQVQQRNAVASMPATGLASRPQPKIAAISANDLVNLVGKQKKT